MEIEVGIDLGTTNSVVATVEDGAPVVIPNRAGYKLTPSVIALSRSGKRLVGHLAKRQAVTNPEQSIYAIKRLIGRKWSAPQVEEVRQRAPYQLKEGPHDDIRVVLGEQEFSLPEISAMVLSELRLDAEAYFGAPVTKAVITVPAYFNDQQRQATKDAGKIAGLDVLRIINEPTAAALAYGFGKQIHKKVVVFDLGGGTLDVSILDIANGVFDVIATGGDTYLGGEDFDQRLLDWLLDPFVKQHGVDLREDKMALQRLKDAAEKAKCDLSSGPQVDINLPFIITGATGSLHLQQTVTREQLEALTIDLVDRCTAICAQVLHEAGLTIREIDEVLLVGGQTRMPRIQEAVRKMFGKDPSKGVHPDEVVALGAAIQGRALAAESGQSEVLLLDVTPHSLGISIAGGLFQILIPKNTTVPTSARHLFTTTRDNQTSARIVVLQGEHLESGRNELLGEFILSGFKGTSRGIAEIEVIFDISADGIVSVSARDTETNLRQAITVTATSGLTEDEVRKMMDQNADYLLTAKNDETLRRQMEAFLRQTEDLHGRVKGAVGDSMLAQDTLLKGVEGIKKLKSALEGRDAALLNVAKADLDPIVEVYRSILQRLPGNA